VYRGSVCRARRSPSGFGWALEHRHCRIRDKLRAQFCSVEECFAALDEDSSGTLNRRELAVGLAKVGVWLDGREVNALLDALDTDGGGTVDIKEFKAFVQGGSSVQTWTPASHPIARPRSLEGSILHTGKKIEGGSIGPSSQAGSQPGSRVSSRPSSRPGSRPTSRMSKGNGAGSNDGVEGGL